METPSKPKWHIHGRMDVHHVMAPLVPGTFVLYGPQGIPSVQQSAHLPDGFSDICLLFGCMGCIIA